MSHEAERLTPHVLRLYAVLIQREHKDVADEFFDQVQERLYLPKPQIVYPKKTIYIGRRAIETVAFPLLLLCCLASLATAATIPTSWGRVSQSNGMARGVYFDTDRPVYLNSVSFWAGDVQSPTAHFSIYNMHLHELSRIELRLDGFELRQHFFRPGIRLNSGPYYFFFSGEFRIGCESSEANSSFATMRILGLKVGPKDWLIQLMQSQ